MRRINKKGFTLPELLAAVVIIGILSTIAIVSVNNVMKKSHKEYDKKQNKLFTTAAQTYFTDNRSELPKKLLTEKEITLKELIKENYIEKIVDYKKELYNQEESKAYVKKMGRGRYKYYSELVGSDGRIVTDKETSKKSSNISVNIEDNYNTDETDMPEDLKDGNNTSIYYVNKILRMKVSGRASSGGISSWQYKIEKKTEQGRWKKYKSSGEIEVDKESFEDTITINAKDFANGTYKLVVYAYSYDGDALNYAEKESKTIVIDKTKPKCEIEMSRKPDGLEVNPTDFGITDGKKYNWYKKGDLIAKMNITETNKYKYTIGLDEQTYNINYNEENKKTEEEYTIEHNVVGKYIYGYIQDKAGNVGKCNTDKPIYYDKTNPTCDIKLNSATPDGDNGWYKNNVTLNLNSYDDIDFDGESGVRDQELTTTNPYKFPTPAPLIYSNNTNATQGETKGTTWYGYVRDKAGNETECDSKTIKVDKTDPECIVNISGTPGQNGWYKQTNPKANLTATDDTSGIVVNSVALNDYKKEYWEKTIDIPDTSDVTIYGYVKDAAGREGYCSFESVKVDTQPPECKWEGERTEWKNFSPTITLSCGKDNGTSGCSDQKTTYTYDKNTQTANEQGTISDKAGNETTCGKTLNVYFDKTAPILTSSLSGNQITVTCNDTETFTESGFSSIEYQGELDPNKTISNNNIISHQYLVNGDKHTSFTCKDKAGNSSKIEGLKENKDDEEKTIYCRCRAGVKKCNNNNNCFEKDAVVFGKGNKACDDGKSFCNCTKEHITSGGYHFYAGELYPDCST